LDVTNVDFVNTTSAALLDGEAEEEKERMPREEERSG